MSRESASISLAAPAKINLSLRILGKRPDGFHDLETFMAPLELADAVEISHAGGEGVRFLCNDPDLPSGDDNLCVKAAEAFLKGTGLDEGGHGLSVTLMKKIPHGAGLGGGSSDAAAVLKGLNELFDHPLVPEELGLLAASLGSDVPFFLHDAPAICRGRGEILGEAPTLPDRGILLVKPPFPVSTAWAYGRHAEMMERNEYLPAEEIQHLGEIVLGNDLEPPVFAKYLLLPVMKEWLRRQEGVESAFMTGSGSTMVAIITPGTPESRISAIRAGIVAEFGRTMWSAFTAFAPIGDR